MITFKQGESKLVPIGVTDGVQPDFSDATDIIVTLFVGTTKQYAYSKNTAQGYGVVEVDGSDSSKLNVFVEREQSIAFIVGSLSANVTAKFPNIAFPDDTEIKVWDSIVGRVTAGRALDEVL